MLDALFVQLPPLPLDLVAALAPEGAQVVVEGLVLAVLPVELEPDLGDEVEILQRIHLVPAAEVDVDRRELVASTDLHQRPAQDADDPAAVDSRRGQETRAHDRREGHAHEHLGIVLDARLHGVACPLVVEDELAHAVGLEVHGAGPEDLLAPFDDEVVR